MGLPFLPVRGIKGTDMGRLHPEYAETTCPFTGEVLVAVPPLSPDVALLHAPMGDMHGNLHLEQPYVLDERFAGASRAVVATVDRIVSADRLADAGVTIPGYLVQAVTEVPYGAHPASCYPGYSYDREHVGVYVGAAASDETMGEYLREWVHIPDGEEGYRAKVGEASLARLAGWSESVDAWKGLFV